MQLTSNISTNTNLPRKGQTNSKNAFQHETFNQIKANKDPFKGNIDPNIIKLKLIKQISAAEDKINRLNNYDSFMAKRTAKAYCQIEIEKNNLKWYNICKKNAIKKKWLNKYHQEQKEIKNLEQLRPSLQKIINIYKSILKQYNYLLENKTEKLIPKDIPNNLKDTLKIINNMLKITHTITKR